LAVQDHDGTTVRRDDPILLQLRKHPIDSLPTGTSQGCEIALGHRQKERTRRVSKQLGTMNKDSRNSRLQILKVKEADLFKQSSKPFGQKSDRDSLSRL